MNYTIGEVLKIMNITEGTIRNYEKKQLFNSKRLNGNKYRHYDYKDLNRIATIRKYRNLGLSIDEIKTLLSFNNVEDTQILLKTHYTKLIHEANNLIEKANKINFDIKKIDKVKQYLNKFSIVTRSDFSFYPYNTISPKRDIVKKNLFDDYVSIVRKEEIYKSIYPVVGYTKNNNTNLIDKGKVYKACKCVYTVIEVKPSHQGIASFSDLIKESINYINTHKYELIDDILCIKLLTLEKKGEQYDYYELFLPIKNKD